MKKSKKPSGTKAEQLLESTTFYVDDCLGKTVAFVLRADGWKVEWHRDHFKNDNVLDVEIYDYIGPKNWVFLTADRNIRYKYHEIDMLIMRNIKAISLSKGERTGEQMAQLFIMHKLDIGRALKKHQYPFIGYLQQNGLEIPKAVLERIAIRETLLRESGEIE